MRDIVFRGKRVDNGEWIAGSLHLYGEDAYIFDVCDFPEDSDWWPVDPKTVGQYTGLLDKNGTKIFEGDIVEGHVHSAWVRRLQRCVIAYGRDGFEARHHIGGFDSDYYTYRVLFSKDVQAVGNIHDNPELLEETK